MSMKKSDREIVFNKYGGRCAYCGCELEKGWHVDEIEPIQRKYKWVGNNYYSKETGEVATEEDVKDFHFLENFEWKPRRKVTDGFVHPERLHIDNQNPACASCNINKHSMSLEQFRKSIQGFMKHLNEVSTQYKIAKRYGLITETNIEVKFYFERLKS